MKAAPNCNRLCWLLLCVFLCGCGKSATETSEHKVATKKFYWVQPLKGHPVHQMTQIGFTEGCRKLGYDVEIIGTDNSDVAGTIALTEQAFARGDAAGVAIWTGNPSWNPFIERIGKSGIPVVLPHFPVPEGSVPGATAIISCDPSEYARQAAIVIGTAIAGKGAVAITQGSFNSTENLVSEVFTKSMKELFPSVTVLPPEEEGFDAPKAISKSVSILQAHPDVVAALSTTGGGATTWAEGQKEAGRKITAVAMDYTRVNLDMVKEGQIHALIGQPLWEESYGAAEILDKVVRGEKVPWWTKLPAPLITSSNLAPYYAMLDKVEAVIKR
jgi:ribose transport system substrate-binding protein